MKKSTNGFTLIEMLVVCLIIVILAGLVFRMTTMISVKNKEAEVKKRLEMVANALEEFKAIYGKYPPVGMRRAKNGGDYADGSGAFCPFYYEYPGKEAFAKGLAGEEAARNLIKGGHATDERWGYHTTVYPGPEPVAEDNFFTFGLCSFFVPRVNGTADTGPKVFRNMPECTQWNIYNDGNAGGDSQRDLDAVRRILPHLGARLKDEPDDDGKVRLVVDTTAKGCILGIGGWPNRSERCTSSGSRTNWLATVYDPLSPSGKDHLCYWSAPPYETYKLWSKGADGATGTDDDIVWGSY